MNASEKKQALLDAVYKAYFIDRYAENNALVRSVSRDFVPAQVDQIALSEALIFQVRRSETPAVDVERTLEGLRVGATHSLWDTFFEWYESLRGVDTKAFELCLGSHVLEAVSREEGLIRNGRVLRLTKSPGAIIGQGALSEAEFVNRFISQVRSATTNRRYATLLKKRLRTSKAVLERVKRFVKTASSGNMPYWPVCVELVLPGVSFSPEALNFTLTRLQCFIEGLRGSSPSGGVVRLFWAVEHLSDLGFRLQIVVWFDARLLDFQATMSSVSHVWLHAAGRNNDPYAVFHPRLSRLSHHGRYWDPGWHWLAQLDEIRQILNRDRYIRLRAPESQALYGFERLDG